MIDIERAIRVIEHNCNNCNVKNTDCCNSCVQKFALQALQEKAERENPKPSLKRLFDSDAKERKQKNEIYIRLKQPCYTFNRVGDILKADSFCNETGSVHVKGKNHLRFGKGCECNDEFWIYLAGEYELLTDYKPTKNILIKPIKVNSKRAYIHKCSDGTALFCETLLGTGYIDINFCPMCGSYDRG